MQLFLIYKGHFTWQDVDTMPIYELVWYYEKLCEWRKEEAEAASGEPESKHEPPSAAVADPFK